MDSIFSYDSKLVQMLLKLADLMLLNMLFLVCCIPLVTIGAAQTGLHTAIRQMQSKEDDTSIYAAFFRGFTNGFCKITVVFTVGLVGILLLIWAAGIAFIISGNGFSAWVCTIAAALVILFHSLLTPFHANFDCKPLHLIKNVFLMTLAHPLRTFGVAVLTWIPFLALLLDLQFFLQGFPIWFFLYYAVAFLFCYSLLKKPFNGLKEDFFEAQKQAEAQPTLEEAQSDAEASTAEEATAPETAGAGSTDVV